MDQTRIHARRAGLLYLVLALLAPISLSFVPGELAASGGLSAEVIRANAGLLRLGLASELVYQVLEVYIALALFALFRPVDKALALQMLVLGLLPIPIVFVNQISSYAAIALATDQSLAASAALEWGDRLVQLLHDMHSTGLIVAGVFWGLWLFPLGWLIIKSDFLPRLLGWSVIVGGAGYMLRAFAVLTLPDLVSGTGEEVLRKTANILMLGEVPVIFGLLWLGFRRRNG